MPDKSKDVHGEFDEDAFIDEYEAIADTFIDTVGAARSLKRLVDTNARIFELGMGTGYFANLLHQDGYQVSGIQPQDGMLTRLKRDYPELEIKGEAYLQDYSFDSEYDAIVSHSSVFLFTKPDESQPQEDPSGLIFQSFIHDQTEVFENFSRVMSALTPKGRLFINIQPNAHRMRQVNDNLSFEMISCYYDWDKNRVEKVFAITSNGVRKVLAPDVSYVLKWQDYIKSIGNLGYTSQVSDDGYWVTISR